MTDTAQTPDRELKIAQLEDEIQRIRNKLNNDGFVCKAPAATIEKEKIRLADVERDLQQLLARQ